MSPKLTVPGRILSQGEPPASESPRKTCLLNRKRTIGTRLFTCGRRLMKCFMVWTLPLLRDLDVSRGRRFAAYYPGSRSKGPNSQHSIRLHNAPFASFWDSVMAQDGRERCCPVLRWNKISQRNRGVRVILVSCIELKKSIFS